MTDQFGQHDGQNPTAAKGARHAMSSLPPESAPGDAPENASSGHLPQSAKREQILRGAERVFLASGYEGASMSQIAREAGVSKGTLYNHFDGKASLFSAFFESLSRERFAAVDAVFRADGRDTRDVLTEFAEATITALLDPTCMGLYRIIIGEVEKFPNLADTFWRHGFGRKLAQISDWLARRTLSGELAVPDPDFAAEQLMVLSQARIIHRRRFILPVDDSPEAIRRLAAVTADCFLRIYGSRMR